jgi:Na+-driven multidrug efflux pump
MGLMLLLKILFNIIFIVHMRLGILGCVLASFFSNAIICVWMFYELFVMNSEDKLTLKGYRPDWDLIRQVVRVGVPAMLTSLMLNLGFFLITMKRKSTARSY